MPSPHYYNTAQMASKPMRLYQGQISFSKPVESCTQYEYRKLKLITTGLDLRIVLFDCAATTWKSDRRRNMHRINSCTLIEIIK